MDTATFAFDERLDTGFLDELFEGDKEHTAIVFEQFLSGIHLYLKEADDNFFPGNMELFRQKVHKLKPVFSFVGLTGLTHEAEVIENQCRQNCGFAEIENSYKDFKNAIAEFIPVIESELLKLK
ncbi:MAG TPA: hypothetical protein VIJ92_18055 [Ginsengibacter sp.]